MPGERHGETEEVRTARHSAASGELGFTTYIFVAFLLGTNSHAVAGIPVQVVMVVVVMPCTVGCENMHALSGVTVDKPSHRKRGANAGDT